MRGSLRNSNGFTLLEVIVAIVIISTLAAAFAPLIVSSIQRIKWAGQRTQELYAARSVMERKLSGAEDLSDAVVTTVTVKGPNFHHEVQGLIVASGDFVSFVYPQSELVGE